uniref:Uncharacterized protein n=1 Tax=Pseudoalteromonas rubra TaxID=43658 RepID=A0A0F4QEI0_9GAMM|nr:hypothetical protein TW77_22370 [Pseudoalteromonas rubra]
MVATQPEYLFVVLKYKNIQERLGFLVATNLTVAICSALSPYAPIHAHAPDSSVMIRAITIASNNFNVGITAT